MTEAGGSGAGAVLAGIFLTLLGACLVLVGGGCTFIGLFGALDPGAFVISLGIFALGVLSLRGAGRLFRGEPVVPPPAPPPAERDGP